MHQQVNMSREKKLKKKLKKTKKKHSTNNIKPPLILQETQEKQAYYQLPAKGIPYITITIVPLFQLPTEDYSHHHGGVNPAKAPAPLVHPKAPPLVHVLHACPMVVIIWSSRSFFLHLIFVIYI